MHRFALGALVLAACAPPPEVEIRPDPETARDEAAGAMPAEPPTTPAVLLLPLDEPEASASPPHPSVAEPARPRRARSAIPRSVRASARWNEEIRIVPAVTTPSPAVGRTTPLTPDEESERARFYACYGERIHGPTDGFASAFAIHDCLDTIRPPGAPDAWRPTWWERRLVTAR